MKRPIAVIDTTLLSRLSFLPEVEAILPWVFAQVLVPRSVRDEIGRQPGYGRKRLRNLMAEGAGFYEACTAGDPFTVDFLAADLDPGEAEALAQAQDLLAIGETDVRVIVDEARAVGIAQNLGLTVMRTGRLLLELKILGGIEQVAPLLDRLASQGFHLSMAAREQILRDAGEL